MKKGFIWILITALILSSINIPMPAYASEIIESIVTEEDEEINYGSGAYNLSGTVSANSLEDDATYYLNGDTTIILEDNDNKKVEAIRHAYGGNEYNLEIQGSNKGTLTVNGVVEPGWNENTSTLKLSGGKVVCYQFASGGDIIITDGELYTESICSDHGDVKISGGTVVASNDTQQQGIYACNKIKISGGKVTARSTHLDGIAASGDITITGGVIDAYGGSNNCGINTNGKLIIAGDNTFVTVEGDNKAVWAGTDIAFSNSLNIKQPSTDKTLIVKNGNELVTSDTYDSVKDASITPLSATYEISASSSLCDFGDVEYDYTVPEARTITIENTGTGPIKLNEINNEDIKDFAVTNLSSTFLLSGEKASFTIQPKADLSSGEHSVRIPVTTDQSDTRVEITAKINVKAFPYKFDMSDALTIDSEKEGYDPDKVNNNEVFVINVSANKETLHFKDVSPNDFVVEFEDKELPYASSTGIKFFPKSGLNAGEYKETITIETDEGAQAFIVVDFKVFPWYYDISVSPATLDFGRMTEGYSKAPKAQTVTVTNVGDANVTLMDPSTFSSRYDITTQDDLTLAPYDELTLTIQPKLGLTYGNENIEIKTEQGSSAELSLKFDVGYFLEGEVKAADLAENADYQIIGDTVLTIDAGDDKTVNSIKYRNEYNLEIKGSNLGTLTIDGNLQAGWDGDSNLLKLSGGKVVCSQFANGGDISINGGELYTESLCSNYGNIYVSGGTVVASNDSQQHAIYACKKIEISGGKVTGRSTQLEGIFAIDDITITGGVVDAAGGTYQDNPHCGIETNGKILIYGDNTFVTAEGDLEAIIASGCDIADTLSLLQPSLHVNVVYDPIESSHPGKFVTENEDELVKEIAIMPIGISGCGNLTINPESIDFGETVIGESVPDAKTVYVENTGLIPLTLKDIVSDKFLVTGYSQNILLPKESASFTLVPDTDKIWAEGVGTYAEEVYVISPGLCEKKFNVTVNAVEPQYSFSVSTDSIDLGKLPAGYEDEMPYCTVTVKNTGNVTLKGLDVYTYDNFWIKDFKFKDLAPSEIMEFKVTANDSLCENAGDYAGKVKVVASHADDVYIDTFLHVIDVPKDRILIEEIPDQTYTGKEIKPSLDIFYNGMKLSSKDYTVTYKNNVASADKNATKKKKSIAPTVIVKGKGNYSGTAVKTFNILSADIADAEASDIVLQYKNSVQKGMTKVTYLIGGKKVTLKEKKDYRFEYSEDSYKDPGTYSVKIVGIGNYTGEKTISETILESDKLLLSKVTIPKIPDQRYSGSCIVLSDSPEDGEVSALTKDRKKTFNFVIKNTKKEALVYGTDYTLSYENNKNIGTATVTIIGMGNYVGTRTVTFKITGTALSKVKTEGFVNSISYTGKPLLQPMKLYVKSGKTKNYLTENEDYTVTYKNNIDVGTATVIYTGINFYTGKLTKTYKIMGLDMKKVNIPTTFAETTGRFGDKNYTSIGCYDSKTGKFIYTGGAFNVAGPANATKEADNYGIKLYYHNADTGVDTYYKNGVDYVVTYKNNILPGKATVTFTGKKSLSGSVSRTFNIVPLNIYEYAGDRVNISLPGGNTYRYTKGGVKPVPKVEVDSYSDEYKTWYISEIDNITGKKKGNGFSLSYNKYTDCVTTVNKPSVTIKGMGVYSGTFGPMEYTITVASLDNDAHMNIFAMDYQNKAGICKVPLSVFDTESGKILKAGTDYKMPDKYYYTYATTVRLKNSNKTVLRAAGDEVLKNDIIPANTYINFTLTGINNYAGNDPTNPSTLSRRFIVVDKKKDLSKAKITIRPQYYTGKRIELTAEDISITIGGDKCNLTLGEDYYITYDFRKYDYTKPGTHKVVIKTNGHDGEGYYNELTVSFKIKAKSLNEKVISNNKDLFVSAITGDDDNVGSEEHPFKTIQKAIDMAVAGTVINVNSGIYDEMLTFEKSGTADAPIILRGNSCTVEDGYLTCNTKLTYTGEADNITLININGKSNIVIEKFDIGDIKAHDAEGIFMPLNSKNITVSECRIHDIKVVKEDSGYNAKGDCANAILCLGEGKKAAQAIDNIVIRNCEICNNVTNWSESVSFAGNVINVKVCNNFVHDNTNIGIDFNGNTGYCKTASLDQPRYCEASGNVVQNCRSSYANCAGIYVDGARDIVIDKNIVTGCDYGIEIGAEIKKDKYPVSNITVKRNIIEDNYCGGIWIGGYDEKETGIVKDVLVYSNNLKDNVKEEGYGEIVLNRCDNISFLLNGITNTADVSKDVKFILNEMDVKYSSGFSFIQNSYSSKKSEDDIHFVINGQDILGLSNFALKTGADDYYYINYD